MGGWPKDKNSDFWRGQCQSLYICGSGTGIWPGITLFEWQWVTKLIMSELCTQMGSFSLGIKVDHEPQVVLVVKNPPATAG